MRHPPELKYSGLSIVLDYPSRHDKKLLLSGSAGQFFESCLNPISRLCCDIGDKDSFNDDYLPETKVVLHLGDGCISNDTSLGEIRGYTRKDKDGIVHINSFAPQDSFDRRDYNEAEDDEDDEENQNEGDVKGHGKTKRRNWRWWMMQDVKKTVKILRREKEEPDLASKYEVRICPPIEEVIEILKNTKNEVLFTDIETTAGQIMTCFGFNFSNSNQVYVIPWRRYNGTFNYDIIYLNRLIQAIAIAFANNLVVCHNAGFDLLVLCWRYRIPIPFNIFCTMLSWHRCFPEVEKSLGHLISYFLEVQPHKSEGVYNPKTYEQEQQLFHYNAKDVFRMREVYYKLLEEIKKLRVEDSVRNVNSYIQPYILCSLTGMKMDIEKFIARFEQLEFKRLQLNRCVQIITGHPDFNPRSHVQVSKYLYGKLGVPCPDEDEPTRKRTLLKVLLKDQIPSLKLILSSRKTAKMASGMKFRLWPRFGEVYDRFTTVYNPAGTDTFRLGSRGMFKYSRGAATEKKGYGSNAQNWDKNQRDLIISDTDKTLGQVDQAGAEALVVAYLCRMGKFRSLFLNGIKSHVFVGLHVFKDAWRTRISNPDVVDELCKLHPKNLREHPGFKEVESLIQESDNWPASERYYFIAKMICHASNYGMKAPTFQMQVLDKSDGNVALSVKECKAFLDLYHFLFPEIQEWHYEIRQELEKTRILTNLFGETRRFNEPFGEDLWKQGYAFKPQSTVGEITNRAFRDLQNEIDQRIIDETWKLDLLQNGHDSILFQAQNNFIIDAAKLVRSKIEVELLTPRGEKFRMKSECAIGKNWRPWKKGINEEGLKEIKLD